MTTPIDFKEDLARFTPEMLRKLEKHRDWGRSWQDGASLSRLWDFLHHEMDELERALVDGGCDRIVEECADVANLCMMIADVAKRRAESK